MTRDGAATRRPHALLLYQFFHPDDVAGARVFAQLGAELVQRGWRVTARPANRACHTPRTRYRDRDDWAGVAIRRIWRPPWKQASGLGRMANAVWMLARWCTLALQRCDRPDVVVVGTDPILSVAVAAAWRRLQPSTPVVHWAFDVYPEAAVADGRLAASGFAAAAFGRIARAGYRACEGIVDLGPCMRSVLAAYEADARRETIPPWALSEPDRALEPDAAERATLFGTAPLALAYSGSYGRAHDASLFLRLADALAGDGLHLCFSVRGHRVAELREAVGGDRPHVSFAPFASMDRIATRLGAADIHAVSLRDAWTGMVVPSKFFGALACGRPVLFTGAPGSAIARWIEAHGVGWLLTEASFDAVVSSLRTLSQSADARQAMHEHCFRVYHRHFSRRVACDRWDALLRDALPGALA